MSLTRKNKFIPIKSLPKQYPKLLTKTCLLSSLWHPRSQNQLNWTILLLLNLLVDGFSPPPLQCYLRESNYERWLPCYISLHLLLTLCSSYAAKSAPLGNCSAFCIVKKCLKDWLKSNLTGNNVLTHCTCSTATLYIHTNYFYFLVLLHFTIAYIIVLAVSCS